MKWNIFLTFLIIAGNLGFGQENRSKADNYFFGYEYKKAIEAYTKERAKKPLTDAQLLNLADAYFKTGAYENASKIYMDSNKKDTIMSVHRFNKMLQSLSKTSDKERVVTFLKTKSASLSSEFLENATFNYELILTCLMSRLTVRKLTHHLHFTRTNCCLVVVANKKTKTHTFQLENPIWISMLLR